MKTAPDHAAAALVIHEAFDGPNPAADVVTVVYRDRKVGQFRRWIDGRTVSHTPASILVDLSAMTQLWSQAPESKPHGARTCARKTRMKAVLARYGTDTDPSFVEELWGAVK